MALGFRMGGAGGTPKDNRLWIIKDGVIQVPFDETVYKASSVYNVGGQWSYSAARYLYRSILAVNTACVGYAATNAVDVTNYSQIRVIGRALQTNAWQDKTYSLASVSGSYYFVVDVLRSSGGVTGLNVYLTNAKDNYSTNRVWTQQVDSTSNTTNSNYSQIKDIYLEP